MFEVETLPPPPGGDAPAPRRPSVLRLAVTPEALPFDPPAAAAPRRGLLRSILADEELPEDPPAPPRGGRSGDLARWLFAAEPLPEDEVAPPRHGGRWLAWLTRPEDLDQNDE
ncbi:MAG: hypothetical protein HZB56_20605 [Deltaproteobacteria bacterium]|nr:hypothetical protein [Deltaproteobacteria bacterium]